MKETNGELKEALQSEYGRLEGRRQDLQDQVHAIERELEDVVKRLTHVRALLGEGFAEWMPSGAQSGQDSPGEPTPEDGSDPVEIAFAVLEERAGEPTHYRELAEVVLQRGGELPGADPAQTLVSRLVRDSRFVRPYRRGYYALRLHHPKGRSVGARRKPAKRRSANGRRRT